MKNLTLLLLLFVSGAFAQTDVKFTAKITNRDSDLITIAGPAKFKKEIKINDKGDFTDTFAAPAGIYQMVHGKGYTLLYLKPGYDLTLTMDFKKFDETVAYKGKGEKENNFLAMKILMEIAFENNAPNLKGKAEFDAAVAVYNKEVTDKLNDKTLDPDFRTAVSNMMKQEIGQMEAQAKETEVVQKINGTVSPSFDYENHKGGKTKLEDLRGKYVYIDVWATWCGPCRAEIPFLQKVEEKYKGKNITFVSMSVDEKKDYEKWKKMVTDKSLGGTQLIADNNWNSAFITAYAINSIPRFILIDPKGNVIDADAKRPSDAALEVQLDKLLN
jgi:thiol-disulfide isomerase/thioredoxin